MPVGSGQDETFVSKLLQVMAVWIPRPADFEFEHLFERDRDLLRGRAVLPGLVRPLRQSRGDRDLLRCLHRGEDDDDVDDDDEDDSLRLRALAKRRSQNLPLDDNDRDGRGLAGVLRVGREREREC